MNLLRMSIKEVRAICMKHPGMWQDFQAKSKIAGIEFEIPRADFEAINRKYFPESRPGEALHAALTPVAVLLDSALGTELSKCGKCATRELKLNSKLGR